jgi:dienelactone hydrolase
MLLLLLLLQDPVVLPPGAGADRLLGEDARARIRAANQRESKAWAEIRTREDWERYRDDRLRALRESLGAWPAPADLHPRVTRVIEGDGYRIENVVFESRPGLRVTANLYGPSTPSASMPGVIILHSHHNPKTQAELQDMGILWARAGCRVLVPDQLGHGERRQHPFKDAASFPAAFKVGRQDYWFRYTLSLQLSLAGESLMGWMVWDVHRGVDLLLSRPDVDKNRILLLGSVAGGGDPAGVAAALDPRIACVVPFNFGGPQPESPYPLPEDAATSFNYAGGGSWESTRNLRLSARDGFLPWVIVGSVAPRRLVHAHEFSWDRERDPVWKRYERIWGFYEKPDGLSFATGRGRLSGQPPEASHCNNIGADHRKGGIYAAFERWFGIPAPAKENANRHPSEDLLCGAASTPVHELVANTKPRGALREEWARILGGVDPSEFSVIDRGADRFSLEAEGVAVPALFLRPDREGKTPVVVAFAQDGKAGFLRHRKKDVDALLDAGIAVCLADLRGTGETSPGKDLGRSSAMTSISATELMLGRTIAGLRVRDLRGLLRVLRARKDVDASRIALWGDAFAPVNAPDARVDVPWDAPKTPEVGHPMGGLTALLGALFEEDVRAVYARGGLESYASALRSPFLHVPHDAMVPGALLAGDLPAVEAALAPRPVRLEGRIDGLNRAVGPAAGSASAWLIEHLR